MSSAGSDGGVASGPQQGGTTAASSSAAPATGLTDEAIDMLSNAAVRALTSMDKAERDSCAEQLLFLSSYDYWDLTKSMLPRCSNNYLRFMVCKAIHFIVSNELGPQERETMRTYVLGYVKDRRDHGEQLPPFVRNELYSIYASALYSNWKLSIISSESSESAGSSHDVALRIVDELQFFLQSEEVLDCLLEVITYFSRQDTKVVIYSVRSNFAKYVLPHFFSVAAGYLSEVTEKAATVCCTVLESIPDTTLPRFAPRLPTDPSVYLLRWEAWVGVLPNVIDFCGNALLENPYSDFTTMFGSLLRTCSTVMCSQEEYLESREALTEKIVLLSESLLGVCQKDNNLTGILRLSCALLVNAFERNQDAVVVYFRSRPQVIAAWADATQFVLARFADEEDELRQALMHLFFLVADTLLPPAPHRPGEDLLSIGIRTYPPTPSRMGRQSRQLSPPSTTPPRGGGGCRYLLDNPNTQQSQQPSQQLSSLNQPGPLQSIEHTKEAHRLIMAVFNAYFDTVVDKAHLREDSQEIRTEAGVILHNERTLLPMAEMLFCDRADFVSPLIERLSKTLAQYRRCVEVRQQMLAAQESPMFAAGAQAGIEESLLSLAMEHMDVNFDMRRSDAPLVLMHVCLSRLSVIVSIFAIAMVNGTARRDETVFQLIAGFARELLTEDDQLTDSLLQCLSLFDASGSGSCGNRDAVAGGTQASSGGSSTSAAKFHLGILRSLFFFCGCVYESDFSRQPEFYEISINLLRYVYLYHSDVPSIMTDANVLLHRLVTNGVSGTSFIGSEKLMTLIQAVKEDRVKALQFPFDAQGPLPQDTAEARRGFLTAFTLFVETRYYAGYAVADVVETLVLRTLSKERVLNNPFQSLEDIEAITRGCRQPDTFQTILEGVMLSRQTLLEVVKNATGCAPAMTKWFATVCSLAKRMMVDSALSQSPWELVSLVLNSLCLHFSYLSYPTQANANIMRGECTVSPPSARFFCFPADAVDPAVVYDLADIVQSICGGSWCNVGVMIHYERATVEHFFCGAIELLLSVSVQMLMSTDTGRARVFQALLAVLEMSGPTFEQLHTLFMRQGIWEKLLRHLTKCLAYLFMPELLQLIHILVYSNGVHRAQVPDYVGISNTAIAATFHEVAVLVVVAPHLEIRELKNSFSILTHCFHVASALCTDAMTRLLDYCSAYHRVRLRMILTMLTANRTEMLESYMSVFGQSSKVGVLSAW